MDRLRKSIEIASNVAIIGLALLIGFFLTTKLSSRPTEIAPSTQSGNRLQRGATMPAGILDFSTNDKNLLLVLSTACHYCTASIPFYKQLIEKNAINGSVRIVASFPQDEPTIKRYLSENRLTFDSVIVATPSQMLAGGTPTLILVNRDGAIVNSWIGKLTPELEKDVIKTVFPD